jgi:hypothetical protein
MTVCSPSEYLWVKPVVPRNLCNVSSFHDLNPVVRKAEEGMPALSGACSCEGPSYRRLRRMLPCMHLPRSRPIRQINAEFPHRPDREHATTAQPTLFRGGKIFTIQPF